MADRIELDPPAIRRLIHSAAIEELRADTPAERRERAIDTAITALDALCATVERHGTDDVWDVLSELDRRELLAFATFAVSELSDTEYSAAWRAAHPAATGEPDSPVS